MSKSGQTYWKPEGRRKTGPKAGQIKWVRRRFGVMLLRYRIKHALKKTRLLVADILMPRVSKHHNRAKPKRDFARRRH